MAVVGRLDLLGIARGHGRDRARGQDGRLHEVDIAVHLHKARAEVGVVDAHDVLEHVPAIAALEGDIVDGEDGLDAGVVRPAGEHEVVVDRDERGLPVVAVDDVGLPVEVGQDLEHGLTKVCEPFGVVILAIELGAGKIVLVVDEVIDDAALVIAEDAAVLVAPAKLDVGVFDVGHLVAEVLADGAVQRAEDAHVMPGPGQRLGQRAGHVAKAAGLDKGGDLRADKHNFHSSIPSPESSKAGASLCWTLPLCKRYQK